MKKDKNFTIIFDLRDVLFNYHPEHRGTEKQFSVIKKGLKILLQCHAPIDEYGKKKHKLYALSNATPASYHNFITYHAHIFSHFNGIVTSGNSGFSKPDARAFYHIIERYNLDPAQCIFIDDKKVNVLTAQAVGMHAIICDTHENVIQALTKLGVF